MVCLFWLAFLLVNYDSMHRANRFLIVFYSVATTLYGCHAIYLYQNVVAVYQVSVLERFVDPINFLCSQSVYPLYLIYIRLLTAERVALRKYIPLFLPAVLLSITAAVIMVYIPEEELAMLGSRVVTHDISFYDISVWAQLRLVHRIAATLCMLVNLVIFLIISMRSVYLFRQRIMNFYADTHERSLRNISYLLCVFVCSTFISAVSIVLGRRYFVDQNIGLLLIAAFFALILFMIGYLSYQQKFFIGNLVWDEIRVDRSVNYLVANDPRLDPDEVGSRELCEQIRCVFEKEELHCDQDFSILFLAERLRCRRKELLHVINDEMGMTFNALVNHYRIDTARRLMADYPERSDSQIALEAGFSSVDSFYRKFKKMTSMTPERWRRSCRGMSDE